MIVSNTVEARGNFYAQEGLLVVSISRIGMITEHCKATDCNATEMTRQGKKKKEEKRGKKERRETGKKSLFSIFSGFWPQLQATVVSNSPYSIWEPVRFSVENQHIKVNSHLYRHKHSSDYTSRLQ